MTPIGSGRGTHGIGIAVITVSPADPRHVHTSTRPHVHTSTRPQVHRSTRCDAMAMLRRKIIQPLYPRSHSYDKEPHHYGSSDDGLAAVAVARAQSERRSSSLDRAGLTLGHKPVTDGGFS